MNNNDNDKNDDHDQSNNDRQEITSNNNDNNNDDNDNETETETSKTPTTKDRSLMSLKRNATIINVTEQLVELPDTVPFSTIVYGTNYDKNDESKNIEDIKNMELNVEAIR